MAVTVTMQHTSRHLSWIDYYIKVSEDLKGPVEVVGRGYGAFDRLSEGYVHDQTKLIKRIDENPMFNFMLVPTFEKGGLNIAHCLSAFEDVTDDSVSIIGVNGTRFNSPWDVIELESYWDLANPFGLSTDEPNTARRQTSYHGQRSLASFPMFHLLH